MNGKLFRDREETMKILQIASCILACIFVTAAVLGGIFGGLVYALVFAALALVFTGVMFFAKKKAGPAVRTPDFMNSDEENEKINEENRPGGSG